LVCGWLQLTFRLGAVAALWRYFFLLR
jgi:hypothetical protein